MKQLLIILCAILFHSISYAQIDLNKNGKKDVYEDPKANIEERISDLIAQMTMEEKTCQLATLYGSGRVLKDALPTPEWKTKIWKDGIGNIDEEHNGVGKFKSAYAFPYSKHIETIHTIQKWFIENTRLGIPVDFTNEGIRGLCHDRATSFPAQCGQGATWDKNLIYNIGMVEGKEASALGYTNIYSPILDIVQDPRWGRAEEVYGEDPFLVGQLGKQMILALQKNGVAATIKHFAVYSVPVGGRDGGTRTDPHVAPREMKTLYLEPFRVAVEEAHAMGVMSSYNDYDGVPVTGSSYFLTDILRHQWGFNGYVTTDSRALEFITEKHKVAPTMEDAVAMAVNAGVNIRTDFSIPEDFLNPLREAIKDGKVSMEMLDKRVAEVLRVKFRLGLFDNPYRGDANQVHTAAAQALSLQAALESIVLLKNDAHTLPLSKSLKSVAVIGPNAKEVEGLLSRYGPANAPLITVYDGIKAMLPGAAVGYEKGCDIVGKHFPEDEILAFPADSAEQSMLDAAVDLAKKSELTILVLGGSEKTVREDRSRTSLDLPVVQERLLEAVYATGKPVVLVLLDGRAASINFAQRNIPAIIHGWFPGEFGGEAIASVLFGDYNPGGKLAVTFPKSVGQIPYAFPFKPGSEASAKTAVNGALYPFGFGLSYTTFGYSELKVTPAQQGPEGNITVSCKVRNTGSVKGDEVIQLYIHDEFSSVITYTQVLRGFERVTLAPGEEKEVSFVLGKHELGLWDINDHFTVEPGKFEIMVGSSSKDIRLRGSVEIVSK
ncbi:glycoside hydrolase family 3 N-terminal domain-containing protein [Chitinophaga sancti]|uniref:Beta-glucosidase n=1 Tax=Chitinophaga sancti TaxID=1004 RepID=A0A1K1SH38_9BACT|nr:glycoside hydrolase family 3 N-terminal domain-containing protein [Chitinophaga sancti]WQD59842.1 glycoside hydrolase family 3 N-terminal domain-containing protein [Chitinophaga sancti]WQG88027.1 glycoside hydrolase family 3 N-terminal domain-containing protein [Chitinophaga sancti]SFW83221.1 beta-glucosidase [Chitinophaga sancti]